METEKTKKATSKAKKIDTEAKEELSEIMDVESEPADIDFDDVTGEIKIGDDVRVLVKSMVFGKLVIKLKDGVQYEFNRAGETQEMTMRGLRELKATQHSFYKNQWVLVLGVSPSEASDCKATPADVYRSLGIDKFYKGYIDPTSFADVCSFTPGEIATRTKLISVQAKGNLIIALKSYIEKGVMTDLKLIEAWEKNLGCELLDKR